ncbi:MAG: GGDEF domain-containing protein [Candidatus Schekmanbacteria bacterium]|nr:GGDEF domain-containing protein [Candidatus Schekmanbacteria bacterium]
MPFDDTKITDLSQIVKQEVSALREKIPFLLVISGQDGDREFEVRDEMVIGRDENADLPLNSRLISRHHAIIEEIGGNFRLQDLNSTNGTFVNGDRVADSIVLKNGDIIHIGEVIFKFVIRDPAESEYQRRIQDMAMRDALTGIYNRGFFMTVAERELDQATNSDQTLSLILFDIDHFKKINDNYGHPIGDFVLKTLAGILTNSLRKHDLFARYGGEEFAILLKHRCREEAGVLADRLRRKVEDFPFKTEDVELHVSISLGVANFPTDATTLPDLIQRADQALYTAKNAGRNQCFLYGSTIKHGSSPQSDAE